MPTDVEAAKMPLSLPATIGDLNLLDARHPAAPSDSKHQKPILIMGGTALQNAKVIEALQVIANGVGICAHHHTHYYIISPDTLTQGSPLREMREHGRA